MAEIIEYKCPHCGAGIQYSGNQMMKCPYCDSEFTFDEAKAAASYVDADSSGNCWEKEESESFGIYSCTSCGAELICDSTTAATRCPYCDNVIVYQSRLSGELKPDLLLPFSVTRAQAVEGLQKHLRGKKLLPNVFKTENHIEEVKGVYVPFWLFDTTADADAEYEMTNVRTWSDRNYIYTETSHFEAERKGRTIFQNVPVDGLKDMANDLMESIETFDVSEAVEFRPEYLSGFYANRYDVCSEEAVSRAAERITVSAAEELDRTVTGYATIRRRSSTVELNNTRIKYALFPVWLLNTTWRGKTYLFAMNGQSGKFVGDLPIDNGKYWLMRMAISLAISGVLFAGLRYFGFM